MDRQSISFIPESAPFNPVQRLWLNGFMAGLLAAKNHAPVGVSESAAAVSAVPLVILFGSQTGTAEKIARQIARESKARGCSGRVVDSSAHASVDWARETNLLIVTSTYGDGDLPDNAQGFWEWLKTENAKTLAHLNYSVLALGDTNYENFCAAGKKFDQRLEELGAKRIRPRADCDTNYEPLVKEWTDGVWSVLTPALAIAPSPPEAAPTASAGWSKSNPFPSRLVTNRRLNAAGSQKETRHFEFSLEGSGLGYTAGDALGVWAANCPESVAEILAATGLKGEEAINIDGAEIPLHQALAEKLDVTRPSLELLQHFALGDPALMERLKPENKEDFKRWLWGREILDFLAGNSAMKLTAARLVALLKPLQPRLYSISSSPKAHPGQVHLTVNIVRYQSLGRARKGVASTFLADRAGAETPVPVFFQTASNFRLPADGQVPVIMVGPGTGVAPFRAFLHERRATGASGRNWLFFGEQRLETDFYYREELEKMFSDGHLTKLSTAFSRDQADKIYVQNRLQEHAAELWTWLDAGAHFYVCGDASRMAKDVDDALHRAIEFGGGKNAKEARAFVANMKAGKRYQRDVY